jgi:elongation factor P hydroxylase
MGDMPYKVEVDIDPMEITAEDYGYDINFTVKKADNTALSLTGISKVKFQVVSADDSRSILDVDCVVVEAGTGKVKYTVQNGNFNKADQFLGALELQYTTKRITTKKFFMTVKKKSA